MQMSFMPSTCQPCVRTRVSRGKNGFYLHGVYGLASSGLKFDFDEERHHPIALQMAFRSSRIMSIATQTEAYVLYKCTCKRIHITGSIRNRIEQVNYRNTCDNSMWEAFLQLSGAEEKEGKRRGLNVKAKSTCCGYYTQAIHKILGPLWF